MDKELDSLTTAILAEYERNGRVNTKEWLARFPGRAAEIVDWVILLDGSPNEEDIHRAGWEDDGGIAAQALQAVCEAVPDALSSADRLLGDKLAKLRLVAGDVPSKPAFQRAAVLAWVVGCLAPHGERVTRLATQKTLYFLEVSMNLNLFVHFKEMPLGPYDPTARYKDAEPIALKQYWITRDGTALRPGSKVADAEHYAVRYVRSRSLATQLLERLTLLSDNQFETWATVHAVARQLSSDAKPVTYESITKALNANNVWRSKLARPHFAESKIHGALAELRNLRLIDG